MFFPKKQKNDLAGINPNETINYNMIDLMDELHTRFFQSFELTLDIADYVPQIYIDKVCKQIYKVQKRKYKEIYKTDKSYQKWFKERLPQLLAERRQCAQQDLLNKKDGSDGE